MPERKLRVLFVASHPVQYTSPQLRRLAQHPRLEIQVAYCSLQGAQRGLDPEFGREVQWDVPLLEGYPWVEVSNRARNPGIGRFWGLVNTGLWKMVRKGRYDAVVIFTGYVYASFWIVAAAAKLSGVPLLFGTDAHELGSRDRRSWKTFVKARLWPRLFRLADVVIAPSTATVRLMHALGIPPERVVLVPYVVDNDWWRDRAAVVNRSAVRNSWKIPEAAPVALFCAKLQPWKRPLDALRAFARAQLNGSYLVYAGDGPLRGQLEAEAQRLGVADRVRLLGFQNQSELPAVYRASDLFVLPSEYEPFGVVVNEAILCGCVPAVSDRVGAATDLIRAGENGFVYPAGDVDALARVMTEAMANLPQLRAMSSTQRQPIDTWSPREYVEKMVEALELATRGTRGGSQRASK